MDKMMENFKSHVVASMNGDVYYQLKSYLCECDLDDDEYREALDYIANNITGELKWVE
jgi:hypothetical protein